MRHYGIHSIPWLFLLVRVANGLSKCYYPGKQADPNDCRAYFECIEGIKVRRTCANKQVYFGKFGKCVKVPDKICVPKPGAVNYRGTKCVKNKERRSALVSCDSYLECQNRIYTEVKCPDRKVFSTLLGACVHSDDVCRTEVRTETGATVNISVIQEDSSNYIHQCERDSEIFTGTHADPYDCTLYFKCGVDHPQSDELAWENKGVVESMRCKDETLFDENSLECKHPSKVFCGERFRDTDRFGPDPVFSGRGILGRSMNKTNPRLALPPGRYILQRVPDSYAEQKAKKVQNSVRRAYKAHRNSSEEDEEDPAIPDELVSLLDDNAVADTSTSPTLEKGAVKPIILGRGIIPLDSARGPAARVDKPRLHGAIPVVDIPENFFKRYRKGRRRKKDPTARHRRKKRPRAKSPKLKTKATENMLDVINGPTEVGERTTTRPIAVMMIEKRKHKKKGKRKRKKGGRNGTAKSTFMNMAALSSRTIAQLHERETATVTTAITPHLNAQPLLVPTNPRSLNPEPRMVTTITRNFTAQPNESTTNGVTQISTTPTISYNAAIEHQIGRFTTVPSNAITEHFVPVTPSSSNGNNTQHRLPSTSQANNYTQANAPFTIQLNQAVLPTISSTNISQLNSQPKASAPTSVKSPIHVQPQVTIATLKAHPTVVMTTTSPPRNNILASSQFTTVKPPVAETLLTTPAYLDHNTTVLAMSILLMNTSDASSSMKSSGSLQTKSPRSVISVAKSNTSSNILSHKTIGSTTEIAANVTERPNVARAGRYVSSKSIPAQTVTLNSKLLGIRSKTAAQELSTIPEHQKLTDNASVALITPYSNQNLTTISPVKVQARNAIGLSRSVNQNILMSVPSTASNDLNDAGSMTAPTRTNGAVNATILLTKLPQEAQFKAANATVLNTILVLDGVGNHAPVESNPSSPSEMIKKDIVTASVINNIPAVATEIPVTTLGTSPSYGAAIKLLEFANIPSDTLNDIHPTSFNGSGLTEDNCTQPSTDQIKLKDDIEILLPVNHSSNFEMHKNSSNGLISAKRLRKTIIRRTETEFFDPQQNGSEAGGNMSSSFSNPKVLVRVVETETIYDGDGSEEGRITHSVVGETPEEIIEFAERQLDRILKEDQLAKRYKKKTSQNLKPLLTGESSSHPMNSNKIPFRAGKDFIAISTRAGNQTL